MRAPKRTSAHATRPLSKRGRNYRQADMKPVTIHAAKTNLSKLVERACAGEEIIIARGKTPVVKLVPIAARPARVYGSWKGRFKVPKSFFDPLPEDELRRWEGYED